MRDQIESVLGNHRIYEVREKKYDTGQKVPFRVSPNPLTLTEQQKKEILSIGNDIASYFHEVDALYHTDSTIRNILNIGKPDIFISNRAYQYLFIRPDIIISENGFTVCENTNFIHASSASINTAVS